MTKTRPLTLIVAPHNLVLMWQKKYAKIDFLKILELQTIYLIQSSKLANLYQPLMLDKKESNSCKNNVIVFTSKHNLEMRIIKNSI